MPSLNLLHIPPHPMLKLLNPFNSYFITLFFYAEKKKAPLVGGA
jgi:hypothetical protein